MLNAQAPCTPFLYSLYSPVLHPPPLPKAQLKKKDNFVLSPSTYILLLKNRIYKYMASISKNVYNDKLDDIVKYNNINITIHITAQLK